MAEAGHQIIKSAIQKKLLDSNTDKTTQQKLRRTIL